MEAIDMHALIGRPVVSATGKEIGKVDTVLVHPTTFALEALRVGDKTINRHMIHAITDEHVVLAPSRDRLEGLNVVDLNGRLIGTVSYVQRSSPTHSLTGLIVHQAKGDILIGETEIEQISDHVRLNVPFEV